MAEQDGDNLATPDGLLRAALKRIPALWWAVGVVALLALIAIVSR